MPDYLRDPEEIYRSSFAQVRAATDLSGVPEDLQTLVIRLVHACAMPDIITDLAWYGAPLNTGKTAISNGSRILCDCQMLAVGIMRSKLSANNEIICTLNNSTVPQRAKQQQTTRSAAAVEDWLPYLQDAVVAIGNAPTALFRLLELLQQGAAKPALILAFPVGFVGAAESKEALLNARTGIPYVTLRGRRGGSALAAAAVNSLLLS